MSKKQNEENENVENIDQQETKEEYVSIWKIIWDDWIKSILIALILALVIRVFIFAPTVVIGPSMEPTLQDPSHATSDTTEYSKYGNDRLIAERLTLFTGKNFERGEIITFTEPTSLHYIKEGTEKFKSYLFERRDYIKRVIGVGGDTIKVYGEKMMLDGIEVSDYKIDGNILYVNDTKVTGDSTFVISNAYVTVNGEKIDESYLGEEWFASITVKDGIIDTRSGATSDINIDLTVPEGYLYVMGDNRKVSFDSRKFTKDTETEENRAYAAVNGCIKESEVTGRVICRFWPFDRLGTVD